MLIVERFSMKGNMEQAIQVYVYSAIGCVPAVFCVLQAVNSFNCTRHNPAVLNFVVASTSPQYAITPSLGPGEIGIEEFLCKAGEPLWQLNKLRNKV